MANKYSIHYTKPTNPSQDMQHTRYQDQHVSTTTDMSPPNRKRRDTLHDANDEPSPKRRNQSELGFDSSMNLVRNTPSGLSVPLEQGIANPAHYNEEGKFVDAPEELPMKHEPNDCEEDEDLFKDTFGMKADQTSRHVGEGDDDDLVDGQNVGPNSKPSPAKVPKSDQPATNPPIESEHTAPCTGKPGFSTPPPPSTTITRSQPKQGGDPTHTLSLPLRAHQRFRLRCLPLIPRLNLAEHRYWIGICPADRKPNNIHSEKHLVWMKGNRLTTVETIWHSYQTSTMTEGFVLLLGGVEKVGKGVKCEEMDYFGDRKVFLMAVDGDDVQKARGRKVSEGAVPVAVVEIEDD